MNNLNYPLGVSKNNPPLRFFQKIKEKHLQSNQYQDLFFEIRHIRTKYVYFLYPRKAFAIKSIPRSIFRNL